MRRRALRLRGLACAAAASAAFAAPALRAVDVLLPMSPAGQVWTKTVPTFQAACVETTRDPFGQLDTMDLKLKRFVARHNLNQIKPLVIELPDLDWKPERGDKIRFMVPLPPDSGIIPPEGEEIAVEERDGCPVVSIAFKGAYAWANVAPHMKTLAAWVKAQNRVIEGRPRLLLYHHLAFRPDWMRFAELQVPVR